jgi:hypothetical protein
VYWPTLVPAAAVPQRVLIDGEEIPIPHPSVDADPAPIQPPPADTATVPAGPTRQVPLGRIAGARSGDKGGNANVGVWTRTPEAYAWLAEFLTVERFRELIPDAATLPVERHALPNLRALNFVVTGLLGRGVAASPRLDAQAKALGEELRARVVDVPESLVPEG